MRRVLYGFALSLTGLSQMLKLLVGVALHVFTTWAAFHISGTLASVITFFTPVFSQCYWIFKIYSETGYFWSYISIGSAFYIALWLVLIICASVAAAAEPK